MAIKILIINLIFYRKFINKKEKYPMNSEKANKKQFELESDYSLLNLSYLTKIITPVVIPDNPIIVFFELNFKYLSYFFFF